MGFFARSNFVRKKVSWLQKVITICNHGWGCGPRKVLAGGKTRGEAGPWGAIPCSVAGLGLSLFCPQGPSFMDVRITRLSLKFVRYFPTRTAFWERGEWMSFSRETELLIRSE